MDRKKATVMRVAGVQIVDPYLYCEDELQLQYCNTVYSIARIRVLAYCALRMITVRVRYEYYNTRCVVSTKMVIHNLVKYVRVVM